jgi:hypothetical protein
MLKVITMTAYRRPQYTREVLDALSRCNGIGDWQFLPHIEPGHEEVIEAVRMFDACEKIVTVNPTRLGLNRNTFQCVDQANTIKAEVLVHLEDDTVPSPDALKFFEWAFERWSSDSTVFSISGYNNPKNAPTNLQRFECRYGRPKFTCWGWGTWRDRLRQMIVHWCFRDPRSFAHNLNRRVRGNRTELHPQLSRIQNIGYELGENGRTAEWYRANHRAPWVAEGDEGGRFHLPGE